MQTVALIDNFRVNVKDALSDAGISQRALAVAVGIHHVTICRILSGDVTPSLETCENIAKAAGLRADTVFLAPAEKIG